MVEQTLSAQCITWSPNVLTQIVLMMSPDESIQRLKLWAVSKHFR